MCGSCVIGLRSYILPCLCAHIKQQPHACAVVSICVSSAGAGILTPAVTHKRVLTDLVVICVWWLLLLVVLFAIVGDVVGITMVDSVIVRC